MKTVSPLAIAERNIETYPFTGDWNKILGEPDIRFSTLIRGEAKSGKSTYCAKFSQYCSQFGKVLYVSAEERLNSKTLQNRLKLCNVVSPKVRFIHTRNIDEIEKKIQTGGFRFVIIDSIQHVDMSYQEFETLKQCEQNLSVVNYRGISLCKWGYLLQNGNTKLMYL